MRTSVNLSQDEAKPLKSAPERLGVKPKYLARPVLVGRLAQPQEDFQRATEHAL
jgi:hypothetical protein